MTRRWLPVLLPLALMACGPDTGVSDTDDEDEIVVPEGKEDSFYSSSAAEYWVSGPAKVTLDETDLRLTATAKAKRVADLVTLNNIRISWFLNTFLINKESEESNATYGGFGAIARFYSEETTAPTSADGRVYAYTYKVQVGGSKTLLTKIPGTTVSGGKKFDLKVGLVSNTELARLDTNHEWYRDAPWSSFDPSKASPSQVETITVTMTRQTATADAWLPYDRLFADGELTIALHTGWDYHARYDITSARNVYNWLVQNGFKSPVASFDKLDRTSGPLTKTITANRKSVNVKVSIFHPGDPANKVLGPDPDTDAGGKVLEDDMRESFAKREVIMYLGHSGPLYGFALANWRKTEQGDLDDSDVPGLTMPKTYQLVLANGCDTYAMGQAFWRNPAKADKKNLNVITTTSFSNAGTEKSAIRLLTALTNQSGGKLTESKLSDLASGLDQDQGYYFDSMFGIHGADANPRYDPFRDASYLCKPCTTDTQCGAADGNRCTKVSSTVKACTYGCIDDSGCPTGYACRSIASAVSSTIKTQQCVPKTLKCATK